MFPIWYQFGFSSLSYLYFYLSYMLMLNNPVLFLRRIWWTHFSKTKNNSTTIPISNINKFTLTLKSFLLHFNNFFFLTHYFGNKYRLIYEKLKSFVYIFVTNSQVFQITLLGYAIQCWMLAWFINYRSCSTWGKHKSIIKNFHFQQNQTMRMGPRLKWSNSNSLSL